MLTGVRVVLVRPRRGGNVGAAARVMKNFGLGELVLVAPRTRVGAVGERMAAHAKDVLRRRRTVATLDAAVADCTLVVGTAGRDFAHLEALEPRALAPEIVAAAAQGKVALVFGPEDHGLANADLGRCQRLIRIPSDDAYPSLNLAQAVAVCAYELRLATLAASGGTAGSAAVKRPRGAARSRSGRDAAHAGSDGPASSSEREALVAHLADALDAVGFLSRQNPQHILADVRALFARAGVTRRDVQIWRGVARQVLWAARRR